jgi:hypothetical protein
MPQLGEADLVFFAPETFQEGGEIMDRLLSATGADLL